MGPPRVHEEERRGYRRRRRVIVPLGTRKLKDKVGKSTKTSNPTKAEEGKRSRYPTSSPGLSRRVGSFIKKVNHPVQGTGADGLKLAMVLLHKRLPDYLAVKPVLAVHDELVVECLDEQAEEAAGFLKVVMVEGMNEVLNPSVDADHPDRVPVEVDVEVVESWGS